MPALFRCRAARSEIAQLFDCELEQDLHWRPTHWPGDLALVIAYRESGGSVSQLMRWGMPGIEKLHWTERNFFSRIAFHEKVEPPGRCLIPVDSFALPDGMPGCRVRSWFGLWDEPIFAWAVLWRQIPGVGPCFVGATTSANALVERVGRAMPVILRGEEYSTWMAGEPVDVMRLWRQPFPAEAMWLEQTSERWVTGEELSGEG